MLVITTRNIRIIHLLLIITLDILIIIIIFRIEPISIATPIITHSSVLQLRKDNIRLIKFQYLPLDSCLNTLITSILMIILKFSGLHFNISNSFTLVYIYQVYSLLVLFIGVDLGISKLEALVVIDDVYLEYL